MHFVGSCIEAESSFIHALQENAVEVSYRTFVKTVPTHLFNEMYPFDDYSWRGKPGWTHLSKDWAVSYHKSVVKDKEYWYIRHSAIEYIFSN